MIKACKTENLDISERRWHVIDLLIYHRFSYQHEQRSVHYTKSLWFERQFSKSVLMSTFRLRRYWSIGSSCSHCQECIENVWELLTCWRYSLLQNNVNRYINHFVLLLSISDWVTDTERDTYPNMWLTRQATELQGLIIEGFWVASHRLDPSCLLEISTSSYEIASSIVRAHTSKQTTRRAHHIKTHKQT